MTVTSEATAVWKGGLIDGSGKVTLAVLGQRHLRRDLEGAQRRLDVRDHP